MRGGGGEPLGAPAGGAWEALAPGPGCWAGGRRAAPTFFWMKAREAPRMASSAV